MDKIKDIFAKPIDRKIEEVIKVDQHDERTVKNELEEYVVTDSIRKHFETVYDEIIQVKNQPVEGTSVWVSGFFGSGKSSFAKILGYTASAKTVLDRNASDIFKDRLKAPKVTALLDSLNRTIPIHAVIFDVSMDRGIKASSDRFSEILYKALLRELDYAQDLDLAELEITLEKDNMLDQFQELFKAIHQGKEWQKRRKLGMAINEASIVLHKLLPKIYTTPDSFALSLGKGRADITPNELAEKAFELAARRQPGKALIFIIDEVGQYVSRSVDKMLDLQGVVQAFGREGKNRTEQKKAVSPFWIIVTSQEKLNEVVESLDSKKIELARLQDRFRITIDLKQTDIPDITGERVLEKKDEARPLLAGIFRENKGRLDTYCRLERTGRDTALDEYSFIKLYPYLPYQVDLCIDIVAGLRLKRGAHRHIGGSNRTIIKQAQQMMIHPNTQLGEASFGTLVTLDKVYELLYAGNLLPNETYLEINKISALLPQNSMALKVAKALALLEVVKNLPRTAHNIAVVLHPAVTSPALKSDVEKALQELQQQAVIKETEEGYKLLTVQEKHWDIERKALAPRRADVNRIARDATGEYFSQLKMLSYRYKNSRTFHIDLFVDNESKKIGGDIPLNIFVTGDEREMQEHIKEARAQQVGNRDQVSWITQCTPEIQRLQAEVYRSAKMIEKYEHIRSQNKLAPQETACLADEKTRYNKEQQVLRTRMGEALLSGNLFFRGVRYDCSALGSTLKETLHNFLEKTIPLLFPKLGMGIRVLKGGEIDKLLTAANLNGLPPVFYEGGKADEQPLVIKESGKYIANSSAGICREVLQYLAAKQDYGLEVTGKMLETQFQGPGYGWEADVVRLVLAILLRAGAVEVSYQGHRYKDYEEPNCRQVFTRIPAFRSASFAQRKPIDLKMLTGAARMVEEITGREVELEEGAIASAFKEVARQDREDLVPLRERMKALELPGLDFLAGHLQKVEGILSMSSGDTVTTLFDEGKSYKDARQKTRLLKDVVSDKNLGLIETARRVVKHKIPLLNARIFDEAYTAKAQELQALIQSPGFYNSLENIKHLTQVVSDRYDTYYWDKHRERAQAFGQVLEKIKGQPSWLELADDEQESVSAAIVAALCSAEKPPHSDEAENLLVCNHCKTTLPMIEYQLFYVSESEAKALREIEELTAPPQPSPVPPVPGEDVVKVNIEQYFSGKVESPGQVEALLDRLKEDLLEFLEQGKTVLFE